MSEATAMLVRFYDEHGNIVRATAGALVPPIGALVSLLGQIRSVARVEVDYDRLVCDVHLALPAGAEPDRRGLSGATVIPGLPAGS